MGKLTISMAIFNSYVSHHQRVISVYICSIFAGQQKTLHVFQALGRKAWNEWREQEMGYPHFLSGEPAGATISL